MHKTLMITLFASIVFFSSCNSKQKADDRGYIVEVGDAAPDFECTLNNGETFKLSDQKGKIVMLQFTASWCGVCRKEMPFIESDIWQKHQNDNFVLIGLDRDEPLETVNKFAAETGITYPLALDTNADIFGLYALKEAGVTRNVIINKEGKIVKLTRLYNEEEFNDMKEVIEQLLSE